jgi:hypothetical protein
VTNQIQHLSLLPSPYVYFLFHIRRLLMFGRTYHTTRSFYQQYKHSIFSITYRHLEEIKKLEGRGSKNPNNIPLRWRWNNESQYITNDWATYRITLYSLRMNKSRVFCIVALNIHGSSVWYLFYITPWSHNFETDHNFKKKGVSLLQHRSRDVRKTN